MSRRAANDRKKDARRDRCRAIDQRSHRAAFERRDLARIVATDCAVDLVDAPRGDGFGGYSVWSAPFEYQQRTPTARQTAHRRQDEHLAARG
jgi:hypothetical protein